jgi:N-acetylmuramoyl-L-alanine amidase-like protein
VFSYAFEHALIKKPIGDLITSIGRQFLGKPYEAHTLDGPGEEHLVVDLHSFDCVTFIENTGALARCIKQNRLTLDRFRAELQLLRYRGGVIRGYASRLHYFTEWIADNEKKGIVKDVTKEIGGTPYRKTIDFMTSHRASYPGLSDDSVFSGMRQIEDTLSGRVIYQIPRSRIARLQSKIRSGDIIAITTDLSGLDVSHTGIAVRLDDGSLHYMHAPNVRGSVLISRETLEAHVKKFPSYTGIIVVRPLEPPE